MKSIPPAILILLFSGMLSIGTLGHAQVERQYTQPHTIHFPKDCSVGWVCIWPKSAKSIKEERNCEAQGDVVITTESVVTLYPSSRDLSRLDRWEQVNPGDITKIEIHNFDLTDDRIKSLVRIARLSKVQSIGLYDCLLNDDGLANICEMTDLHTLYLFKPTGITWQGLCHLKNLKQLETLSLSKLEIQITSSEAIASLPNLQGLGIISCGISEANLLTILKRQNRLSSLSLVDVALPDSSRQFIREMKSLRSFDLRKMSLLQGNISLPQDLIADLPDSLERLCLWNIIMTDRDIASLKTLKGLKRLYLTMSPVTDAILPSIQTLPNLTQLDLRETSVTLAGIKTLAGLKALNSLRLTPEQIDAETIRKLKKERTYLKVFIFRKMRDGGELLNPEILNEQ